MDRVQRSWRRLAAWSLRRKTVVRTPGCTGRLPERDVPPGLRGSNCRSPSNPQDPWSPDYVLTFDGGSLGNPGQGYGSYAIAACKTAPSAWSG